MGKYITQKGTEELKESYKNNRGFYPTWLGEAFGWTGQQIIYNLCEQLCRFLDDLVPEILIIGKIDDILIAVIRAAYNVLAHFFYWDFADRGNEILGQFDRLISDTETKINQAIEDAKGLIERELIAPLQAKAEYINSQLSAAQGKLDDIKRFVDDHEKRLRDLEMKARTEPLSLFKLG